MSEGKTPSILIVDDSADKLVAIESILCDLEVEIVKVRSGREALRRLLVQDFAVVLLDVRMPGMDGFETAALIRGRARSEHTPIIFITAFGDDSHVVRGYSLRAVDYILTPVVPEVLRTKVSVFVELFRTTAEVRRQAESLRVRAAQLHRLTEASLAINSADSIDRMLTAASESAREIIGAARAIAIARIDERRSNRSTSPPGPESDVEADVTLAALVCRTNRPSRTTREIETLPVHGDGGRPIERTHHHALAVPLVARDGRNLGVLQVTDKPGGEFSQEEEDLVFQLAQMASIAIENLLFIELREANRLKDEFLATVSHELRTPLSALRSWVWMLRRGGLDADANTRAIEAMERNVLAQTRIVDDLLDVSRIVTGKLHLRAFPVDLGTITHAALDAIGPAAAAKGITLERDLDGHTAPVLGDADRLQQVVWNLVSNAIKFTPMGGQVAVSLEQLADEIVLRVRDSGRGISASFLPHVFERFRQADASTSRSSSGLGLGLAIVGHLVELHGGRVEAESPGEGRGATFTVTLPVFRASAGPSVTVRLRETASVSGLSIVLVEDDAETREGLSQLFAGAGAQVISACSLREALAALGELAPDVVVCDVGLPGDAGYTFLRTLREAGQDVPVVALTAGGQDHDRERALAAGFAAHVVKPAGPADVLAAVARAVDERPWRRLAPQVTREHPEPAEL
jgi:signal transduction histidine kinase/DNA-binding response OmpR family regulator